MKKIKIALVITRLDRGGAPDLVLCLIKGLNPQRYALSLISGPTRYPARGLQDIARQGINLVFIPQLIRQINPVMDILALFRLYRLFRREAFDIVHTHTAKAGILARAAAKLAGVKKIVHQPHGNNFYGYFGPLGTRLAVILERLAACFTDKIITLTELEKKDLARFKVGSPEKIAVINSGLDLEAYRRPGAGVNTARDEFKISLDTLVVGMVGRLDAVKGARYFVEAASLVLKECAKVRFLVVGDGPLRDRMVSGCKKLNMLDRFIFTGWREDIPRILPALDILVLPSLNEAVGRILLEAGASGIPAVATNVGGVPEIVKDSQTGILVPAKDAYRLAREVILLLKDKQARLRMGESAKSWIGDKFSTAAMVSKTADLYEGLQYLSLK